MPMFCLEDWGAGPPAPPLGYATAVAACIAVLKIKMMTMVMIQTLARDLIRRRLIAGFGLCSSGCDSILTLHIKFDPS